MPFSTLQNFIIPPKSSTLFHKYSNINLHCHSFNPPTFIWVASPVVRRIQRRIGYALKVLPVYVYGGPGWGWRILWSWRFWCSVFSTQGHLGWPRTDRKGRVSKASRAIESKAVLRDFQELNRREGGLMKLVSGKRKSMYKSEKEGRIWHVWRIASTGYHWSIEGEGGRSERQDGEVGGASYCYLHYIGGESIEILNWQQSNIPRTFCYLFQSQEMPMSELPLEHTFCYPSARVEA